MVSGVNGALLVLLVLGVVLGVGCKSRANCVVNGVLMDTAAVVIGVVLSFPSPQFLSACIGVLSGSRGAGEIIPHGEGCASGAASLVVAAGVADES